jgi:hypothetical protein
MQPDVLILQAPAAIHHVVELQGFALQADHDSYHQARLGMMHSKQTNCNLGRQMHLLQQHDAELWQSILTPLL